VTDSARRPDAGRRARSLARRLALQALYQLQLNDLAWQDIHQQFLTDPESERVDRDYFRGLLAGIAAQRETLDAMLAGFSEIAPPELDPIEHAVLWLGLHELQQSPELPFRVVLAEAVQLAKQFGATDGHKYINDRRQSRSDGRMLYSMSNKINLHYTNRFA